MRYDHESIPDRSRPRLPTTASGVVRQGIYGNYATAKHCESKRRKASKKSVETVERETHTCKG